MILNVVDLKLVKNMLNFLIDVYMCIYMYM